jgi:radical SAM superfamily enzyme YgiQ (UPF0313 family)
MTKQNVYLFQPQYAVEFRKENTYWLPYSAGCIWSYVSQFKEITNNFNLCEIIFRREPPDQVIARIKNPAVCGFSCYVWNEKYCLTLAEKIKQKWPDCIIVFGGAQAGGSMIKHSFIDTIVIAEGEENFYEILKTIAEGNRPETFYQKKRLQILDIPSPYTTGLFDKMIADHPTAVWSMTLETNRGCPYACTFCDWGGITYSKVKKFDLSRIQADLDWCANNPISYITCSDANFGIFKERDVEIAKLIVKACNRGRVDSVNLQYAKNSTECVFDIATIIGKYSRGITVSVQSMFDDTLDAVKRKNLDITNIRKLLELSEKHNVPTYTEVILGLPLETLDTWKEGFSKILEMGQHHSIDMWFAQLLENSEMNSFASRQKFGIKSINAKDYMPLHNPGDWREIDEEIMLINATNTMTTDQMVEAYMYGWMILHFHITGYTQIYAKYCRHRHNISYRDFYDQLFLILQNSDTFFFDHYTKLKNIVKHYLYTGELVQFDNFNKTGHGIHALSYKFMYDHQSQAFQLGQQIVESFNATNDQITNLQKHFIFNKEHSYPVQITLDFDIHSWQDSIKSYTITPHTSAGTEFDFYSSRRLGILKNKISQ